MVTLNVSHNCARCAANGKLERYHQRLKVTAIRPKAPSTLEDARRVVTAFVQYYNHERLHSAIGFLTPADMLAGPTEAIWAARDQKLEAARLHRRTARQQSRLPPSTNGLQLLAEVH